MANDPPRCAPPVHAFPEACRRCYCGANDVPQLYERHDKASAPMPKWYRQRETKAASRMARLHPWTSQRPLTKEGPVRPSPVRLPPTRVT